MSSITLNTPKGIQNSTTLEKMTFWSTNFNMPVPTMWSGGTVNLLSDTTTFNLSGLHAGFEVLAAVSYYYFDGTINGTVNLDHWFIRTSDSIETYSQSFSIYVNVSDGSWQWFQDAFSQGIADWEIRDNATYLNNASTSGAFSMSNSQSLTISNCPSVNYSSGTPGYVWVGSSDNCLHYICANDWEFALAGVDLGYVNTSSAGYMWVSTDNRLHWIGSNGNEYTPDFYVQQFASSWSYGAPGPVQGEPGYIWIDNQFGFTHIAYIGYNGYKYLTGDGHYPYTDPY